MTAGPPPEASRALTTSSFDRRNLRGRAVAGTRWHEKRCGFVRRLRERRVSGLVHSFRFLWDRRGDCKN